MKRIITLLLSIILAFGVMSPAVLAAAENNAVQPRYLRISTFDTLFKIDSDGKSTCYCSVRTYEPTDIIELIMELQQLKDSDWETIKTWTGSGTFIKSLDKNWYVVNRNQYQLKVTAKIYDSAGTLLETQVVYHP